MQIEIQESTVQRIAERIRMHGVPELSGPEIVVRILNVLAESECGLTVAEMMEGIRESSAASKPESARQVAERLGLVGAFSSELTDLSTNRKHMSGFGK